MRVVARRVQHFNDEIEVHDAAMKQLVDDAAPQLVAEPGVGYVTAAMFIIAWSHPGRCRSEAAYARLAGVAPVPANSGQSQDRHRLNRYGDRKLNRACHMVALVRMHHHEPTKAYIARRRAEGKTDREIRRCLKRYIARNVWRLLEHQSPKITA
jgi:transposase